MIKIKITMIENSVMRVEASGHGGKKRGEDIVCAAVSAVTQTALSGLLHYCKQGVNHSKSGGRLFIDISDQPDLAKKEACNAILFTMMLGLLSIEREHPLKVKVELDKR